MKKIILAGALASFAASPAMADTVLGVYAGAQAWGMETDGNFSDISTFSGDAQLQDFGFDDETQGAFYIAFEHFIPLVPNVKINRTNLDTAGNTTLTSSFSFGGELYTAQSTVLTEADMTMTDYILYYEIFDNDLVSFDVGINGKHVDGDFVVAEMSSNTTSAESFSGIVPMLYSRAEFGLPFSGLGIYAEGSFLSIDDNTVSDYQIAITYDLIESAALDFTLQAGYRDVSVELDDLDDLNSDLSFSGVFAGIELHF
jgi:outer membrane protein